MSHVCVPVEALMAFGILLGVGATVGATWVCTAIWFVGQIKRIFGEDGWQRFVHARERP